MKKNYSQILFFQFFLTPLKSDAHFAIKAKDLYCTLLLLLVLVPNSLFAQCPTAPGDQVTYGNNTWIGYVYKDTSTNNPPSNPFSTTYIGYVVETPMFQRDYGYDALYAPNVCGGAQNNFTIRYKMRKTYAAGFYTFTVGGDDGYRLSIDGGVTFLISNWIGHSYETTTSASTYLDGQVDLVLEYFEGGGQSSISFMDSSCTDRSTAPTTISGPSTACYGQSITLTASGGSMASSGVGYEWGYGTTPGYYVISGQNSASLTIVPWGTDNFWVRRIDAGPCSNTTWGISKSVTIITPSTAPTSITGTTTLCKGNSTTLTASGGTHVSGSTYQWGTGTTIGSNVLSGQTGASLTVAPSVTTAYWVRRDNGATCGFTTGTSTIVTITPPPGDPAVFGNNSWKIYGYAGNDTSLLTADYIGYYSQSTLGFATQSGVNSWDIALSPSASEGWSGCPVPNNNFTFVHKRKGFPCGSYTVQMLNWDDTCVLYIDGIEQWSCAGTNGTGLCNGLVGTFSLDENSEIEVRTGENTGDAFTALSLTNNTVAGTLATSQNTICRNAKPQDITMSGHSGTISKWQSADDAAFTTGVTDIAATSATLTGNDTGPIATSRYFRAVLSNGSCNVNSNPILITVPDAVVHDFGSWNGPLDSSSSVIISDNYTLTADLEVCSCEISAGATLTIPSGLALTVTNGIKVVPSANIIVENGGSIIQADDDAVNSGSITVKRNTTTMKQFDFTYWSSPVQGWKLQQLSPLTLYNKYYSFSPVTNGWITHLNGDQVMEAGKGYIVRAPQGWSQTNGTAGVYEGLFSGTPNTGNIPVTIQKGAGTYNLIGNPYPSSIDLDVFLTDPANTGVINGTVYLWTHNTAINNTIPGNQAYNYTSDDYAKYNITGGIKTASAAVTGGAAPTGKIASGQGFFIEASSALPNGTYTATFNNSMRVVDNSPFFRTSNQAQGMPGTIEKHRFWLHLSNTAGAYTEMLAGYIAGATNDFDNIYDGKTFPAGNVVGLYSILGNTQLSIQGRALPFSPTDIIPLGYSSTIAGTLSIGLEDFDGLFAGQDIYLFDKTDETYHNLTQADFTFTTATGTFDSRFEVHFGLPAVLGTAPVSGQTAFISARDKKISVRSEYAAISAIEVFDLGGKMIYAKKGIRENTFTTSYMDCGVKVLVVQVTLDNQHTIAKKIIME